MLVEQVSDWLDRLSKASGIVGGLVSVASVLGAYFVGGMRRSRATDIEQAAMSSTVHKQEVNLTTALQEMSKMQQQIALMAQKVSELDNEQKDHRVRIDRNSGSIEFIRGQNDRKGRP